MSVTGYGNIMAERAVRAVAKRIALQLQHLKGPANEQAARAQAAQLAQAAHDRAKTIDNDDFEAWLTAACHPEDGKGSEDLNRLWLSYKCESAMATVELANMAAALAADYLARGSDMP